MSRKIISLLFAVPALLVTASCSFLDTEPQDFVMPDNYFETQAQLESGLLGVYSTLAESSLYGMNMLCRLGLSADLGYDSYTVDRGSVGVYDVSASDAKILNYWRYFYRGIERANTVLKYLHKPEMEESARTRIEAEARFLRAYYHYMLVIRFKNIPKLDKAPENGNAENVQLPQCDPAEMWHWILSEMEWAAPLLPEASTLTGGGRLSQSAAYGIMARVALNMAGNHLKEPAMYAKAKEYAAAVIDKGFHSLNPSYQDIFINLIQDKYDIREVIFEVEFYGNNQSGYTSTAGQVGRINGIRCTENTNNWGNSLGTLRASQAFYQLFDDTDLRRDWTIAPYLYDEELAVKEDCSNEWMRYCGKFRREYELTDPKDPQYTPCNFPILRYSDVLLMYAEAVAADVNNSNAEDLSKAYEYVNMVRRRGHGLDPTTPSSDVDLEPSGKLYLLEEIKDERARELGFELLRKDDLVRWGELYDRMQNIRVTIPDHYVSSYYVAARLYYGNVSRRDDIWPIPSYELGVNRNLKQNDGF